MTDGLLKVGAAPLEGRLGVEGRAADGHEILTLLQAPRRQLANTHTHTETFVRKDLIKLNEHVEETGSIKHLHQVRAYMRLSDATVV